MAQRLPFLWTRFWRRPWHFARWNQTLRFRFRYRGKRPVVIVHQMAKVGSMSVFRTLERALPKRHIFHTHYLNQDTVSQMESAFLRFFRRKGWVWFYDELLAAEVLTERLAARSPDEPKWKIVTLVRDPVARNISSFYQHLEFNFPKWKSSQKADTRSTPELSELFLLESEGTHRFPLTWFQREVRDVFGIDVFATPFPHDQGYAIYSGEAADLLVIRLEDLDRCGTGALREFFDLPDVKLLKVNRADDKPYSKAYQHFRANIEIPDAYLERMYTSHLARHFYRPEELDEFRARWETPPAEAPLVSSAPTLAGAAVGGYEVPTELVGDEVLDREGAGD